ncbi:RNA polymerase sigma factor RpoE [Labilithrix luteola]|uniref:RNA polymerase sigma factor RpoE n=1 Tax=Labilithrix luteola TaxID=1391654 RepID=A0A0K1Q9F5_9BACT|nr:sigma-70 family RNA polymerase sigma factor [Labilithrix luteola]AKV02363.1 RNA polymerase sigma factor RpoE [Labilithrix luteola]
MAADVFENLHADGPGDNAHGASKAVVDEARLRRIVNADYGFLWRSLRRLGVPEADTDDAAQRVLGVLARRLGDVAPGSERAFLFQTALRVASEMRRSKRRSRLTFDNERADDLHDETPGPDTVLEQRKARELLSEVIAQLDLDVAAVFVLFELEELTTNEISALLGLPPGTVSTRLRKARAEFDVIVRRIRARHTSQGRTR